MWASGAAAQTVELADVGTSVPGRVIRATWVGHASAGWSVASGGDFDGDGQADLLIGAPDAFYRTIQNKEFGVAYCHFGGSDSGIFNLSGGDSSGVRLPVGAPGEGWGHSLAGVGDFDGDGWDDLLVGAPLLDDDDATTDAGGVALFRGRRRAASFTHTPSNRMEGTMPAEYAGWSCAAVGDINGDGLMDGLVGAIGAEPGMSARAGSIYVVFDLAFTGAIGDAAGFRIDGAAAQDRAGFSVSGAGDVNGDGIGDILIGAPGAHRGGAGAVGAAYIVFGKSDAAPVDVANLGSDGILIQGIVAGDQAGHSVAGAGDVNGDGLADVVVGAYRADPGGREDAGAAYVVFGKSDTTPVDLSALGIGGLAIDGLAAGDFLGHAVAGAGDVNGDGLNDLILGALGADPGGRSGAGESYVVFGRADTDPVDLGDPGAGVLRIAGIDPADRSGFSVAGGDDFNGDGIDDIFLGTPFALHPTVATTRGETYVVFSPLPNVVALETVTYRAYAAPGDAPRIAFGSTDDGGADSFPAGRCWLDLAAGDDGAGGPSLETLTLTRSNASISGLPGQIENTLWRWETTRVGAGPAELKLRFLERLPVMAMFEAPTPAGPWTHVPTIVDFEQRTARAQVSGPGYFALADFDGTHSLDDLGTPAFPGFRIDGAENNRNSGLSVSGAGDIDGDGRADLLFGVPFAGSGSTGGTGETSLVFGKSDYATVDADDLGAAALRLFGTVSSGTFGYSVSGAGDVNGDGFPDIVIGAYWEDAAYATDEDLPGYHWRTGRAYVVFGSPNPRTRVLTDTEPDGFAVQGFFYNGGLGFSVSGAGDVNGDGLADLLLAAPYQDVDGVRYAGETFVVFGKTDTENVELAELGGAGFRIEGDGTATPHNRNWGTRNVSGVGDVNGDGLDDVLIGLPGAAPYLDGIGPTEAAGRAYVVFGKTNSNVVALADFGMPGNSEGFLIEAADTREFMGWGVCGAGDVNGDGLADIVVGARGSKRYGVYGNGSVYVIFGKTDAETVELGQFGPEGFRIDGATYRDNIGVSVAGVGDLNGDGFGDLLLGGPYSHRNGFFQGNECFVVLGKSDTDVVDLAYLNGGGFRVFTPEYSRLGKSVSASGDVDGDGLADMVLGAPFSNDGGSTSHPGKIYVLFGPGPGVAVEESATYRVRVLPSDAPRVAFGRVGDGSNDSTPDGRFWLDFSAGDDGEEGASHESVTLTRSGGAISGIAEGNVADVLWRWESTRVGAGPAAITVKYVDNELGGFIAPTLYEAPTPSGPWTPLATIADTRANLLHATASGPGYFAIASRHSIGLTEVGGPDLPGFRIDGVDEDERSGSSVSGAGDLNGDGLADLVLGAPDTFAGHLDSGAAYVVFGKSDGDVVELSGLGSSGLRFVGPEFRYGLGGSVSGAGDVNGDGIVDILLAAPSADPGFLDRAGIVYVLFGGPDLANADLTDLGEHGFRIVGADSDGEAGTSVSSAGDVNGDGLADIVIGAPSVDFGAALKTGAAFVVFGKTDTADVDVGALDGVGFRIDGLEEANRFGLSVSGAGDVNGDGLGDVLIGDPFADLSGYNSSTGRAFVIFGKADSAPVDLAALGAGGFAINDFTAREVAGIGVAGAGDVNGDGRADLLVGAWGADAEGRDMAGKAYLVFGKAGAADVDLGALGGGGFSIAGAAQEDRAGFAVAGAGDLNGDGLADLLVASTFADPGGVDYGGEVSVIFGKTDADPIDLADLGPRGFRLEGDDEYELITASLSGAGDVNGDGLADWMLGAPRATADGQPDAGQSYVLFGPGPGIDVARTATYRAFAAPGDAPRLGFGLTGDGSNDSTPDARFWLDLAAGDDGAGGASLESVTLLRNNALAPIEGAEFTPAAWKWESTRIGAGPAELTLKYLADDVPPGATEAGLKVYQWDKPGWPWEALPTTVDTERKLLHVSGAVPGYFAIAGFDSSLLGDTGAEALPGFIIGGGDGRSGWSVSGAGDFNGDGLADVLVGAPYAYKEELLRSGVAYLVFGEPDGAPVNVSEGSARAITIDGLSDSDWLGLSVSGAGDVNGDGYADVFLGAPGDKPAGKSYVLFGRADPTDVQLDDLGDAGFRILGVGPQDRLGTGVSGAGDVNGDGLADLVVGEFPGFNSSGDSYVVFGKANGDPVDLAQLGDGGFRIRSSQFAEQFPETISGAGDVNGDGLDDIIVGGTGADAHGGAFVVFGKSDSAMVRLGDLGTQGFFIEGIDRESDTGNSVAAAGDVNGDGLADLLIGANLSDPGGRWDAGRVFVVFGKRDFDNVELAMIGMSGNGDGFRINGGDVEDWTGWRVAGAGDLNGDGLADLIVDAFQASPRDAFRTGEIYVIFGKSDGDSVEIRSLEAAGFRLDGSSEDEGAGQGISGAGDVNGDGLADLIVGAPYFGEPRQSPPGRSHVVFGPGPGGPVPESATYRAYAGPGDAPRKAIGLTGDGSNDSTPDARFWVDFAAGDDGASSASLETVTLMRHNASIVGASGTTADVMWHWESGRQGAGDATITLRYLNAEIAALEGGEERIRILAAPALDGPWQALDSTVDANRNLVSAVASEAGYFVIEVVPLPLNGVTAR